MDTEIDTAFLLQPSQTQWPPAVAEIATRFPGLTAEQVVDVQMSYQLEITRLEKLIRESNLTEWYQRVSTIEEADRVFV